jgi:hypothetical protein
VVGPAGVYGLSGLLELAQPLRPLETSCAHLPGAVEGGVDRIRKVIHERSYAIS